MGLTRCNKTTVFLNFIFAVFQPQSIAEILLLSVLRKIAILKFYFRFLFWPFYCCWHVILHWPSRLYADFVTTDGFMTSYIDFTIWRP